jgi:hypothetical protein
MGVVLWVKYSYTIEYVYVNILKGYEEYDEGIPGRPTNRWKEQFLSL